jgi:type III pantothenate kinase
MLLTIDISNTSIKAGVFKGDDLLGHWRIATERQKLADDYGMLLLNLLKTSGFSAGEVKGVSMSCVVPPLKAVFDELAKKYLHSTPLIVRPDIVTGVKLSVDNPREVGADRVVNSLATYRLYGGPAIAIAFGTATVFDCISEQGEYLGGAIAPGMMTSLESLTRSAAQLFQVELIRPLKAIGKTTITTMQSGVVLGFAGLVEGLVKRLKAELGSAKVIATGGLADIIAPVTEIIDVVDQQLTLKGLKIIYDLNAGE